MRNCMCSHRRGAFTCVGWQVKPFTCTVLYSAYGVATRRKRGLAAAPRGVSTSRIPDIHVQDSSSGSHGHHHAHLSRTLGRLGWRSSPAGGRSRKGGGGGVGRGRRRAAVVEGDVVDRRGSRCWMVPRSPWRSCVRRQRYAPPPPPLRVRRETTANSRHPTSFSNVSFTRERTRVGSTHIGVGDGHMPPPLPTQKNREKYFSGNNYVKFGHFSGKNRVKFGNFFINFSGKYHKNSGILLIFRA